MKTLVYGFDGMDLPILNSISPEFSEYLAGMHVHAIEDDTLGRGWTKINSGQPPQISNAYFQMPVADGSYKINKNYNLTTPGAQSDGRFEYLWDVAERLGVKSVFVNMPTTSPAPAKGAAFVSGIGGGRYPQDGLDADLYHPADIEQLVNSRFKLDIRLNKKYPDIGTFCDELNDIHRAQSAFLAELGEMKEASFGLYVNKLTVEILNLALHDVLNPGQSDPAVRAALEGHFRSVFTDFKAMVERLAPERIILVSDHGTAPYKYDFNIDLVLERLGFLSFAAQDGARKKLKAQVGKMLPKALKARVKSRLNMQNKRYPQRTPTPDSLAFGTVFDTGNFCGIYLNDDRFGGQTPSGDQAAVTRICDALNATPEFGVLGLVAEPYAPRSIASPHAKGSPDIHIRKPDEIFCQTPTRQTQGRGPAVLGVNPNYRPITPDISGYDYPNTGVKSSRALLASNFEAEETPQSLCDAYTLIVQAMKEGAR